MIQFMEMGDKVRRQKAWEADTMKKLIDEFDDGIFLDETGDFKYTDPELKTIIHRDDINHLGNASKNQLQEHLETINGFHTEDLIELQSIKLVEDKPEVVMGEALSSATNANLRTVSAGSRSQNERLSSHQTSKHHQDKHQASSPRNYKQQYRHPNQQHRTQQPQGLIRSPPPVFPVPYWSPTEPPPPLPNYINHIYTQAPRPDVQAPRPDVQAPRPDVRFRHGYPGNKSFQNGQAYSETFTPRVFQGRFATNAQKHH